MMKNLPSKNTQFRCGISLREIMNGGQAFLVVGTILMEEITLFFRELPVMEPDRIFIIVLVKEPTGMKVLQITMFPNGKNGTI